MQTQQETDKNLRKIRKDNENNERAKKLLSIGEENDRKNPGLLERIGESLINLFTSERSRESKRLDLFLNKKIEDEKIEFNRDEMKELRSYVKVLSGFPCNQLKREELLRKKISDTQEIKRLFQEKLGRGLNAEEVKEYQVFLDRGRNMPNKGDTELTKRYIKGILLQEAAHAIGMKGEGRSIDRKPSLALLEYMTTEYLKSEGDNRAAFNQKLERLQKCVNAFKSDNDRFKPEEMSIEVVKKIIDAINKQNFDSLNLADHFGLQQAPAKTASQNPSSKIIIESSIDERIAALVDKLQVQDIELTDDPNSYPNMVQSRSSSDRSSGSMQL